jgi:hypothetical protein
LHFCDFMISLVPYQQGNNSTQSTSSLLTYEKT